MSDDDFPDELFEVPPTAFVQRRKEVETALRKKGDREGAARVKALTRPTLSVWATNQAVRQRADLVMQLLEASETLVRLQAEAKPDPAGFRRTQAEQAAAIAALTRCAEEQLAEAAGQSRANVAQRVAENLRWGALRRDHREAIKRGRLTTDVEPVDFASLVDEIPLRERAALHENSRAKESSPHHDEMQSHRVQVQEEQRDEQRREQQRALEAKLRDAEREQARLDKLRSNAQQTAERAQQNRARVEQELAQALEHEHEATAEAAAAQEAVDAQHETIRTLTERIDALRTE